jgi:Mg-chelatase subunit ChlI
MRTALLLNAIVPSIGGVLIRGEKGTAKSTMARALADILPQQLTTASYPFRCDPDSSGQGASPPAVVTRPVHVVELPNNATEDRVAGTIDISAALQRGEKRFEPGLLAEANRGILYVDEVNLLGDHLVDLLLNAAAMGVNVVEREGISYAHPARSVLIGTMNPEEGELRPQLLDRLACASTSRACATWTREWRSCADVLSTKNDRAPSRRRTPKSRPPCEPGSSTRAPCSPAFASARKCYG